MSAGRLDLHIEAGATFSRTLTWRDADGALVPLAGLSARMQIRATQPSTTVLLEVSSVPDGGIVLTDPGVIDLTLSAAQTEALGSAIKKGVYDLELASGSGTSEVVVRLLEGSVQIRPEVTRG